MKEDNQCKIIAEKTNAYRYIVTKFDKHGWADAKKYRPIPFDLVTVMIQTGKKVAAWWDKFQWVGRRLKKDDDVIKWKRRRYEVLS